MGCAAYRIEDTLHCRAMNQKISVLTPEPIKLVEDDGVDEATSSENEWKSSFQRVYVSDCTIVNGENGTKFAVWKVTMILQNSQENTACCSSVVTYMRYTDFANFRDVLLQRAPSQHTEIPNLPPKVKWYDAWRHQDVNLNKNWLARRRQGLEFFLNHVMLNRDLFDIAKELILEFMDRKGSEDH